MTANRPIATMVSGVLTLLLGTMLLICTCCSLAWRSLMQRAGPICAQQRKTVIVSRKSRLTGDDAELSRISAHLNNRFVDTQSQ
jgi:hypothetical protein